MANKLQQILNKTIQERDNATRLAIFNQNSKNQVEAENCWDRAKYYQNRVLDITKLINTDKPSAWYYIK